MEFGHPPAVTREVEGRRGVPRGHDDQNSAHQHEASVQALRSPGAGPWAVYLRRPRAGERVQVEYPKNIT